MKNLEIKALCENVSEAEKIAHSLGAEFQWRDWQTDTFFRVTNGRLKLRESGRRAAELIAYFRPDTASARWSDYDILPVDDPQKVKSILTRTLGILEVVRKKRSLFLLANARIHLDTVERLGRFIEFEIVVSDSEQEQRAPEFLAFLQKKFGITSEALVPFAYVDLLLGPFSGEKRPPNQSVTGQC